MEISFHFQKTIGLKSRIRLKEAIARIFSAEHQPAESVSLVFCSDEYLLGINKTYLQHDYFTDIITFDLSVSPAPTIGEIYISVDTVRSNAKFYGESLNRELHRVIFHGVLHLCGFKDKKPADIKRMRAAEGKYLDLYFSS
jgi:rRNA maturation RNase YbeY